MVMINVLNIYLLNKGKSNIRMHVNMYFLKRSESLTIGKIFTVSFVEVL